jgi:lipoyl(octanoyl) transferase
LVAYPILDLDTLNIGLAKYISNLEETNIASLQEYGLTGQRIKDAAGVWLSDKRGERKICAIGVKASRNITMHGLAMNVNTDLTYFDKIVPCGIADKEVTSLQKELKSKVDFEKYKRIFIKSFKQVFNISQTVE